LDRIVDVHYVPSAFMLPYVRAWHPTGRIEVLGHFAD
jgi:hypothetical protein